VSDVEFDRSGSKCFSPDKVKYQSSLSERQAEMAPQPINGLVHDKVRDGLRRHIASAAPLSRWGISYFLRGATAISFIIRLR
jgi:hypothetical protein